MAKLREANSLDRYFLRNALIKLQSALALAREAGAPRLTKKINRAIASCGGALRHVDRRIRATEERHNA